MYALSDIKSLHVEITSKCNASCPMCLRNVLGGKTNPHLPIKELSLSDIKTILPTNFIEQLHKIYFCGNYGDPIMAKELIEVLEFLKDTNKNLKLEIHTNGSARPSDWWKKLGKVASRVVFGIDGLEDTNHIYRRGTKWDVIMRNAKAYIDAGGTAEWTFIVFRHNEHQIFEAQKIAEEMGFKKFNVKKTGRFFSNIKAKGKDAQEVLNEHGEPEYFIEKPLQEKYINPALKKEDDLKSAVGDLKTYFGQTDVNCKVLNEGSLYLTAEGHLFPCCWTANQLYPWYYPKHGSQIWTLINNLPNGLESLNAKTTSLEEIINGPFFKKEIPQNWEKRSLKEGRLFVCGKTCGKRFDPFKAQFQ